MIKHFKIQFHGRSIRMREALFQKSLTIALPQEVYLKIKNITDERKVSMAHWMREVAIESLSRRDMNNEKGGE